MSPHPRKPSAAMTGPTTLVLALLLLPGDAARAGQPTAPPSSAPQRVELSMAQAVDMATRRSPLTARAAAGRAAAQARRTAAKRRFLPRIGLQASYTRLSHVEPGTVSLPFELPGTDSSGMQLGEAIDNRTRFRLTVDQPIYQGGKLLGASRAAQRAVALEDARAQRQQADLRQTVERTYLSVLQARAGRDVAEVSVQVLGAHAKKVSQLVEAGRATALELDVVRASQAEARAGLIRARAGVIAAEEALRTLLGLGPDVELALTEDLTRAADASVPVEAALERDPVAGEGASDVALRTALQRRSELAEARAAVRVREAKADVAQGALLPSAVLRLGYTFANPNERWFPPKVQWKGSWDATIALSWSWGWGTAWHEAEAARMEARQARLALTALEEQTQIEVRRALAKLEGARGQVQAMRVAVEAREAALKRAQTWFDEGRSTSDDIIDRQADLARAQYRLVDAQVAQRLALLELERLGAQDPTGAPRADGSDDADGTDGP